MPGPITSALLAVSITVVQPAAVPLANGGVWAAPTAANFTQVVEQWGAQAGMQKVQVAPQLASLDLSQVSVKAPDLCTAVGKLVGAMKRMQPRPALAECDTAAGRMVIGIAN